MAERVILHCDCNSFYASVELLRYPGLRDMPVAVSGSVDDRHGIILAKNDAAKKYNIKTAETVWQAKRKCPNLVLLPPHHKEYHKYSRYINTIYESYTDRVEPFGIDESWLDITGSWHLFGKNPREVADRLRAHIKNEIGLTISIGLSFNKVFAKLGSDYKKPDATTEITRDNYQELVWPMPAQSMLFVGGKAAAILAELGIKTLGQLANADEELLVQVLGKQGKAMRRYALGQDEEPVLHTGEGEPVKSVGNGLTFRRNLRGMADIRTAVGSLADEVAVRLRQQNLYATTVQVVIKNPELKSISRQKALLYATNLSKDITTAAVELIRANWDLQKPIRMLTITAQNLVDMPFATQTSLFGAEDKMSKKREQLERSMDEIRKKYGRTSIVEANILHNDIGLTSDAHVGEEDSDWEE